VYEYLLGKGLSFDVEENKKFVGQEFALTGKGPMGRKEITELIENNGGSVKSVSKTTNYLVCEDPESNSGKLQKAKKYGTKIISYDELLKIIS
jgi:DNA ligase (NAD+)